jgi:uncharacterized protein YndB with AHSA1/START domain
MTQAATLDAYGELIEPTTLKIERLLPGPIERCWDYLTQSGLRRQWLAAGEMEPKVGGATTLTWRNDELNDPPGQRPEGFGAEHSMEAQITEWDPPRRLAFTWGSTGGVSFELTPQGDKVLLTLIHRRIEDRSTRTNISAGWHMHLAMLTARIEGVTPPDFWSGWQKLKGEYDARLPA